MKEAYNEYIEKYVELNTYEKREEIIEKIRELISVLGNFTKINEDLISRELIDLNKSEVTEDDFLEGVFAYLNILEDLISNNILNNMNNK